MAEHRERGARTPIVCGSACDDTDTVAAVT